MRLVSLFVSFLLLMISGCTSVPPPKPPTIDRSLELTTICDRYQLDCQSDSISQVISIKKDGVTARALVGSEVVVIEGNRVILSSKIKTVRSTIIVPEDFKRKVIDRLSRKQISVGASYKAKLYKTVVIDAGHGGKDPGAIGRTGMQEKKVVLDISKQLKRYLENAGVKVIMTRTTDEFISLQKRTEIASKAKADLFVSVHANAHPKRGIHGLEVYSLKNLNYSELKEDQRQKNHRLLFSKLKMKKNDRDLEAILSDMLYKKKQAESISMAKEFSSDTSKYIKTKNLGPKTSRFFVLRNTLVPSVLVEVGFLSNPKEEKLLKTRDYRKKIAKALAKSIKDFIDGK